MTSSFDGDDREIHGDAGHRRQDDRGPGDVEAQRTRAGNDDLAEDAARPSEILPHDRADQTQRGPYLEGREEVWQGVGDPDAGAGRTTPTPHTSASARAQQAPPGSARG